MTKRRVLRGRTRSARLRGEGSGKAGLGGTVTWFPLARGVAGSAPSGFKGFVAIEVMGPDGRRDSRGKRGHQILRPPSTPYSAPSIHSAGQAEKRRIYCKIAYWRVTASSRTPATPPEVPARDSNPGHAQGRAARGGADPGQVPVGRSCLVLTSRDGASSRGGVAK